MQFRSSDKNVKIRLMIKFEFSKLKQVISMTQHFYVEVTLKIRWYNI